MKMTHNGTSNGSTPVNPGGNEVDMAAVLRMAYESAHMRSPSCTHAAVKALAECALECFWVPALHAHVLIIKTMREGK
jgi:hypothetical protein